MATVYRICGDDRKWICASGFFDLNEGYSKAGAQKVLGGKPSREVVDVYDVASMSQENRMGHGYDLVCRTVVWYRGEDAVLAADVTDDEKKQMLCGQISVGCYAGSALRANLALKKQLTSFAPHWQEKLDEAFGPFPYKADIRNEDGHIFAFAKGTKVEILP